MFPLAAAAWEGEDGEVEQVRMKELGKVLPHGYCCSLNLCAPQEGAPVASFLCQEGSFCCRLAFQNFTVWRENAHKHTISLPPPILFGVLLLASKENEREEITMF